MNTFETFCPQCDAKVQADIESRTESIDIRGEKTDYTATVLVCPQCGIEIGDSRTESKNLERAYNAYRRAHDIFSPEEIKNLRQRYRLSLREFSRFLGFGEQSIARYEGGSIPDDLHNTTLKLASSAQGAAALLEARQDGLGNRTIAAVERFIKTVSRDDESVGFETCLMHSDGFSPEPSKTDGYRATDEARVKALVILLAQKCADLYKTKLQKALFFCDFFSFDKLGKSLTGLQYAHATYGPVMNDMKFMLLVLERCGAIQMEELDWGEIVIARKTAPAVFEVEELELIDCVAAFVNTFPTASALSEFSHTLPGWINTADGELIDYTASVGMVSEAIERRLAQTSTAI